MTDPVAGTAASLADSSASFTWNANPLEQGAGLALSGGGFRAMLFHAGALLRLNEFALLSKLQRISSVSGGSIAAGVLGLIWHQLVPDQRGAFQGFNEAYVEPILAFSHQTIDVGNILTGLLPWTSAAEQIAAAYDKVLFRGAKLQALPDRPQFILCATNLQTAVNFRFSKAYAGDYVVGRVANPDLPLSTAVAASSAFPPFLSPLVLTLAPGSFTDWPDQPAGAGGVLDPASFRSKILLTDGGVYDNHGLEPLVKRYMTIFASDGGAPFARMADVATDPIRQLQHVFDVTDNQVRSLRRRDLIARYQQAKSMNLVGNQIDAYARLGAYGGIDTDPSKVSPVGALPVSPETVHALAGLGSATSAQYPPSSSSIGDTRSAIDACAFITERSPRKMCLPRNGPIQRLLSAEHRRFSLADISTARGEEPQRAT